ncbi:MAG TPA: hypothetical protein VK181_07115 [Rhizobium sp.]|nr:hypothetical protein [Rhizobium sp.]
MSFAEVAGPRPIGSTTDEARSVLSGLLERAAAIATLAEAVESRYMGPQPKNAGGPSTPAEVMGFFQELTQTVNRTHQQLERIESVLRSL